MLLVVRILAFLVLLLGLAVPMVGQAAPGNGNGPDNNNGNAPTDSNGNGPKNNNGIGLGNGNGLGLGNTNGNKLAPAAGPAAPGLPAASAPAGLSEQDLALDAVRSGKALPLSTIVKQAVAHWGGRVIDARLLHTGSGLVYRLTIVSDSGASQHVYVDAKTADPVQVK